MTSESVASLTNALLPLVGAVVGASGAVIVQHSSSRAQRAQYEAQLGASRREEVKSAITNYFEQTQAVQRQLDAREHGVEAQGLKELIERVWLAEKQVEIIASSELSERLIAHARALHEVVRDGDRFPDWWAHCSAFQARLLAQARADLE